MNVCLNVSNDIHIAKRHEDKRKDDDSHPPTSDGNRQHHKMLSVSNAEQHQGKENGMGDTGVRIMVIPKLIK